MAQIDAGKLLGHHHHAGDQQRPTQGFGTEKLFVCDFWLSTDNGRLLANGVQFGIDLSILNV